SVLWSADIPYWPLAFWFWGLAVSMGWVMAPSTDSVMGAVPPEKSGVASAMNDVTRQVGGALGTAIIGSLISSFYASRISGALARAGAVRRQGLDRPGERGRSAAPQVGRREPDARGRRRFHHVARHRVHGGRHRRDPRCYRRSPLAACPARRDPDGRAGDAR